MLVGLGDRRRKNFSIERDRLDPGVQTIDDVGRQVVRQIPSQRGAIAATLIPSIRWARITAA